jgi:exodeoxyribonuclease VII large subunit
MAVPVRADLIGQTLDFARRAIGAYLRGLSQRRSHLAGLARVLPRADQLFAAPRQRFDYAAERLAHALRRNLQEHRRTLAEATAILRPRPIRHHMRVSRERTKALGDRLERCERARLAEARKKVEGLSRVLEGISYRAVLERGFALVRGEGGAIRRRAKTVISGERLTLTFADGDRQALADGEPQPVRHKSARAPKSGSDQGSLL